MSSAVDFMDGRVSRFPGGPQGIDFTGGGKVPHRRNTDVAPFGSSGCSRRSQRRRGGVRGSGGGASVPVVVGVQPGASLAGNDSSEDSSTSSSVWTCRWGGGGRFSSGLGSGTGVRLWGASITRERPGCNASELPAGDDE